MVELFRFRVWYDEENSEYNYDDDIYKHEVPLELIKEIHKSDEVYTIQVCDVFKGQMFVTLSDNKEKIILFVKGFMAGFNIKK